jgi:hypothetical protein
MRYEPPAQLLSITFDLLLQNSGNKEDAIREINGKIIDLQTLLFVPLGANDFACTFSSSTGAPQMAPVFVVPKEGTKEFQILVHGDSTTPYALSNCFPWDQNAVADVERSAGAAVKLTFYFVPCQQEEAK